MSNEKIHFGKNGCTAIEVDPFTPICSHPDVDPSEPLTLDVPVPSFAPTVPPNECACFVFSRGTATEQVTTDCVDHGTATLTIDIAQADADCCTGRYSITPNLAIEMPCMPFTFAETDIRVRSRSGSTRAGDIDGNVNSMVLSKDCCTLTSLFDITLPDCVKGYDPLAIPNSQITCCDRDPDDPTKTVTKHFKLIEMVQDAARCSLYPKVNPITLPCCNQPDTVDDEHEVSIGAQGKIKWKIWREDCETKFSLSADPIQIGQASFCLGDTTFNLQAKWTDDDGKAHTTTASPVQITSATVEQTGCKKYNFSDLTLDLGTISTGGFSSGGDVFKDSEDNNLYMDSSVDTGRTWYGGGIGDMAADVINAIDCRGPNMRRYTSPYGAGTHYITYTTATSNFKLISDQGNYNDKWCSRRKCDDGEGGYTNCDTPPANYVSGNLSMIVPTGAQWHERGLGLTLSHFTYNGSGVLSEMCETNTMILVSPAPSLRPANAAAYPNRNASGLATIPASGDVMSPGLSVNDGPGLRIYGVDGKTTDTTLVETRLGQLEVNCGRGVKTTSCTTAAKNDKLELRVAGGDFMFIGSTVDTANLQINDQLASGAGYVYIPQGTPSQYPWNRRNASNAELVIRVAIATGVEDYKWAFMRFSNSGVLLGVTYAKDDTDNITRNTGNKISAC